MGNEDKRIFIFLQIPLQPFDMLLVQIIGRLVQKQNIRLLKQQLSKLVQLLDASTRLLFAQNLTAAMTDDGNSLIEMLFDVFEKDLIDMLELSDATRKAIEGAR